MCWSNGRLWLKHLCKLLLQEYIISSVSILVIIQLLQQSIGWFFLNSTQNTNHSCSLGWRVECLYLFGRFIEEFILVFHQFHVLKQYSLHKSGDSVHWSPCSHTRMSEVHQHWVIMWTRGSLLAGQIQHLGSIPLSLGSR